MTGYTVHTGSNEKYSGGWDNIFGKKAAGKSDSARKPARKKTASQSAKKRTKKK